MYNKKKLTCHSNEFERLDLKTFLYIHTYYHFVYNDTGDKYRKST